MSLQPAVVRNTGATGTGRGIRGLRAPGMADARQFRPKSLTTDRRDPGIVPIFGWASSIGLLSRPIYPYPREAFFACWPPGTQPKPIRAHDRSGDHAGDQGRGDKSQITGAWRGHRHRRRSAAGRPAHDGGRGAMAPSSIASYPRRCEPGGGH
jgi:hypothetical protein